MANTERLFNASERRVRSLSTVSGIVILEERKSSRQVRSDNLSKDILVITLYELAFYSYTFIEVKRRLPTALDEAENV